MKFRSSALTLALACLSSPLFINGEKVAIGQYELLAAGEPIVEVFEVEPLFSAKVYYEAKTGASILTDVYSGVSDGSPCDSGKNITTSVSTSAVPSGPAYTTTTSDGTINSVEITIADVKNTEAYTATGKNEGKIEMCVRSYLSSGDMMVSFVDTYVGINVDFAAKFQNFTQQVNITATGTSIFEKNVSKTVNLESFLCAPGSNAPSLYKIGQDFGVCVRPTEEYRKQGFAVDGFKSVTCKNSGNSRQLINNSTLDALTTVANSTVASSYLSITGEKAGVSALAFESVVTAGYFAKAEKTFTCEGEANLAQTKTFSYLFPKFDYPPFSYNSATKTHYGFFHGLCVLGATEANTTTTPAMTYHMYPSFNDGVKYTSVLGNPYLKNIDGYGDAACEGGIYFAPQDAPPMGGNVTLNVKTDGGNPTVCAFVEVGGYVQTHGITFIRDGGWPPKLLADGFNHTHDLTVVDGGGTNHHGMAKLYCKELTSAVPARRLSADFSLISRDLEEDADSEESPFVTTIDLSVEGVEELMAASASMSAIYGQIITSLFFGGIVGTTIVIVMVAM